MADTFTYFDSLVQPATIPADGILSRTLLDNDTVRLVVFQFAAGQILSEHTAAMPVVLQVLTGEATLTFGEETREARAGAWAYMPARLKHSVTAKTELVLLLEMLKTR